MKGDEKCLNNSSNYTLTREISRGSQSLWIFLQLKNNATVERTVSLECHNKREIFSKTRNSRQRLGGSVARTGLSHQMVDGWEKFLKNNQLLATSACTHTLTKGWKKSRFDPRMMQFFVWIMRRLERLVKAISFTQFFLLLAEAQPDCERQTSNGLRRAEYLCGVPTNRVI